MARYILATHVKLLTGLRRLCADPGSVENIAVICIILIFIAIPGAAQAAGSDADYTDETVGTDDKQVTKS